MYIISPYHWSLIFFHNVMTLSQIDPSIVIFTNNIHINASCVSNANIGLLLNFFLEKPLSHIDVVLEGMTSTQYQSLCKHGQLVNHSLVVIA